MWGYGPHYGMMGGWGTDGAGPMGMIIWLVILVAIVAGIAWYFQRQQTQPMLPTSRRAGGLDVLEERYARGEIGRDEYLQKKGDLGS